MGIAFSSIPGVGARALWEAIGSEAAERRHENYRLHRLYEIAEASARLNAVYIHSSDVGDADGGGGAGTYEDPYLVRHTGDLALLFANHLSGITNLGIFFYDDDVIPGEAANTDQTIEIDWASVSIGRTGDGTRRPEITGFIPVVAGVGPASVGHVGSVTGVTGTTHTILPDAGVGLIFYWVRGRSASSTNRNDLDVTPYRIAVSEADCQANDYSFFSNGVDSPVINVGPDHDIEMCEITCNTGAGFMFKNVGDVAVDDIIAGGFGMNDPFTAGGGQAVRFEGQATNTFICRRSKLVFGHYHVSGHFVSNTSPDGADPKAGGISTWHDCEFGYHLWDSNGSGDGNVCYNGDGAQEGSRYGCFQLRGGLDGTDAYFAAYDTAYMASHAGAHWPGYANICLDSPHGLTPGTPRAHCSDGEVPTYLAEIDCDYEAVTGVMIFSDAPHSSPPSVADKDLQTSFVFYTKNRRVKVRGLAGNGLIGVHMNPRFEFDDQPPASTYYVVMGAGTSGAFKGIMLNPQFTVRCASGTWTGKSMRIFNISGAAADFRFIHGRIRVTGVSCNGVYTQFGTQLNTSSLYNFILSIENGVTNTNVELTSAAGTNHFTEQTPGTGGILGLAHFGLQLSQYNNLTGVVTLAAAASWTDAAGVHPTCQNASQPLPAGIECWCDALGQRRNPAPNLRSLGPIEANPISHHNMKRVRWRNWQRINP